MLAEALDLNGNGLADQLRVTFAAALVSMGSYEWSGALVDADGLVIGYAYGGPTQLPAGAIRLPLIFSGTAINSHGKDGPYYLKNILLQGPVLGGSAHSTIVRPPPRASTPLRDCVGGIALCDNAC